MAQRRLEQCEAVNCEDYQDIGDTFPTAAENECGTKQTCTGSPWRAL